MKLNFIQRCAYGNDWEGEVHLPESSIIYKYHEYNKSQQEWYIIVHKLDLNVNWEVKGCAQVREYTLGEYIIFHFVNIIALNWQDVGKESFDKFFTEKFGNTYVYRYKQALYEMEDDSTFGVRFKKVRDEQLLCCYKFREIWDDAEIQCSVVHFKNMITLKDDPHIGFMTLRLCDLQLSAYPNKDKFVISHDDTLYKESFELITKMLY